MNPREAARHYAASLIEQALAKAYRERADYALQSHLVLDTFEQAPPNVRVALDKGLDGEEVAEEMAKLAEELRVPACPRCGVDAADDPRHNSHLWRNVPEPRRSIAIRAHAALHWLWSRVPHDETYDKSKWKELEAAIHELVRG